MGELEVTSTARFVASLYKQVVRAKFAGLTYFGDLQGAVGCK